MSFTNTTAAGTFASPPFNEERAAAFADRLLGIVSDGLLTLMTSVGHRTGLFDVLADMAPATSAEIAHAAGLHERYVREWLACMVAGGVIDHDGAAETYFLPREHAASLIRAAGADNIAMFAEQVGHLGAVESTLVRCFHSGAGMSRENFAGLLAVQSEQNRLATETQLVAQVLPLADGLVPRLLAGIDVLDVGCGEGHTVRLLARTFPRSRFQSCDPTDPQRAETCDLVLALHTLHQQPQPERVVAGIHYALRSGGTLLLSEPLASSRLADNIDNPISVAMYAVSTMHCVPVAMADGGRALGSMWGEEATLRLLCQAGFASVTRRRVHGDIFSNHFVATKH